MVAFQVGAVGGESQVRLAFSRPSLAAPSRTAALRSGLPGRRVQLEAMARPQS